MKNTLYFLTGAALSAILFIGYINFLPVGTVDGRIIYKHELNTRLSWAADNTIKNIGKDFAFEKAMADLGIHASNAEIEKEWDDMLERYGGINELNKIMIDTRNSEESLKSSLKNGIMKQKAIEYFASSVPDDENNPNYQMEEGAKRYEEYIQSYEDKVVIKIY